ncbi:MAG TPA: TetR/AcrR family transcriptional regulator [Kiritimatiellia bacterium]|nr:TetR/AcrR family transcriptional regulator [Kiritimatiellia bacterium]
MKTKPGQESSAVRARLLDASVRLFAEQGVAGTTVAEIAAAAGVTSAMVHYYFKTKDQLLDAVVAEKLVGEFIAFVADAIARDASDPLALAERLVWRIVEASDAMPWLPPLWVREVISEGGALREKLIRRVDLGKPERFKAALASAQRAGRVNPGIHPQLTFMSIMALTMLPLSMAKDWDRIPLIGRVSKQDLGRHVVALLKHGLTAAPALAKTQGRKA